MEVNKDVLRWNITQKLRVLGNVVTAALVGFVLGTAAYQRNERERSAMERQIAMNNRLGELVRDYDLVHQLGNGNTDDVRHMLSLELTDILRELHSGGYAANPGQQAFADNFCFHVLREEQQHPEYFLTSSTAARTQQARAWAALQNEMPTFPSLAATKPATADAKNQPAPTDSSTK